MKLTKILDKSQEVKVFGVYDPEDYNFDLNMWSTTKADDVESKFEKIKKKLNCLKLQMKF